MCSYLQLIKPLVYLHWFPKEAKHNWHGYVVGTYCVRLGLQNCIVPYGAIGSLCIYRQKRLKNYVQFFRLGKSITKNMW